MRMLVQEKDFIKFVRVYNTHRLAFCMILDFPCVICIRKGLCNLSISYSILCVDIIKLWKRSSLVVHRECVVFVYIFLDVVWGHVFTGERLKAYTIYLR